MSLAVKTQLAQLFANLAKTRSSRDVKYFLDLISSSSEAEELSQLISAEAVAILTDSGDKESVLWLGNLLVDQLEEAIAESDHPNAHDCKPEIESMRNILKNEPIKQKNGTTKTTI